jgi:hypothetical protein
MYRKVPDGWIFHTGGNSSPRSWDEQLIQGCFQARYHFIKSQHPLLADGKTVPGAGHRVTVVHYKWRDLFEEDKLLRHLRGILTKLNFYFQVDKKRFSFRRFYVAFFSK